MGGLYVLQMVLSRPARLVVGRLGRHRFPVGTYWYVGSARRGLAARIARHGRRDKATHWHIDYFLARATVKQVWAWPETSLTECELARSLEEVAAIGPPHFGASDCRCAGHLLRVCPARLTSAGGLLARLGGRAWPL